MVYIFLQPLVVLPGVAYNTTKLSHNYVAGKPSIHHSISQFHPLFLLLNYFRISFAY